MPCSIFLSHRLTPETPLYGGESNLSINVFTSIDSGHTANSLNLSLPNHAGTHIDVPFHFFNNGKKLSEYDADSWIFHSPQCIDYSAAQDELLDSSEIYECISPQTDILLVRTGFERFRGSTKYWKHNPGLSPTFARTIRNEFTNIRALGMDFISVTAQQHKQEGREAHREFLGDHYHSQPVRLIEDMSLEKFTEKIKTVIVLPLLVEGADGAPCTIIGLTDA